MGTCVADIAVCFQILSLDKDFAMYWSVDLRVSLLLSQSESVFAGKS